MLVVGCWVLFGFAYAMSVLWFFFLSCWYFYYFFGLGWCSRDGGGGLGEEKGEAEAPNHVGKIAGLGAGINIFLGG